MQKLESIASIARNECLKRGSIAWADYWRASASWKTTEGGAKTRLRGSNKDSGAHPGSWFGPMKQRDPKKVGTLGILGTLALRETKTRSAIHNCSVRWTAQVGSWLRDHLLSIRNQSATRILVQDMTCEQFTSLLLMLVQCPTGRKPVICG